MAMNKRLLIPPILYQAYLNYNHNQKLNKKYKNYKFNLSPSQIRKLRSKGFHPSDYVNFNMTMDTIDDYLSLRDYKRLHPINGNFSKLIDSKGFLPFYLKNTPQVNIVYENGVIRLTTGVELSFEISWEKLFSIHKTLICKPLNSSNGNGFEVISIDNYNEIIQRKIKLKHSFIVQEKILQADYANAIFPDALNTLRIFIYRDIDTRGIRILTVGHRFGTSESAPVDNGGIKVGVDIETGKCTEAYGLLGKKYHGFSKTHPDTGFVLEGYKIPEWEKKRDAIIEQFDQIQWLEYGGLDVVFTNDGYRIIEINSMPDLAFQIYKPFLKDKAFLKFLKSKGY